MTTLILSVDKTYVNVGDTVTFTAWFDPLTEIEVVKWGIPEQTIGKIITDNNGSGTLRWKTTEVGAFDIFACHMILLVCWDQSNWITVGVATVLPKKYKCISPTLGCAQVADGTFDSMEACKIGPPTCIAGGGNGGGGACISGQINIFGSCYKTSDVAITGGAAVLLFMMMRK